MNEKTEVLFLCQYFYPEYVSSATLPFDTASALVKAGFSVAALCGYPKEFNSTGDVALEEVHAGIFIKRLRYLQLDRVSALGRLVNYFSFTAAVFTRFLYLRNFKVLIVYTNPPVLPLVAAWASRLFNSRLILVSYDVYPEIALITGSISEKGLIHRTMNFINRRVYRQVHKVVALSHDMKAFLLRHRKGLTEDQVAVIPNWFEEPADQGGREGEGGGTLTDRYQGELIVSFFGNMGTCQDLDTILTAMRMLKEEAGIRFLFAGHGNKKDALAKTVQDEGLEQAVVYDFLHGQDYQDALDRTDVFVLSLVEGVTGLAVPSRIYGYLMAGKPVIAIMGAEADIARDLTEYQAGYVIAPGDADRLVRALQELKNSETLQREMGAASRRIHEAKYIREAAFAKYRTLINDALEYGKNV